MLDYDQIGIERDQRIRWYIELHYNYFVQKMLESTDELVRKDCVKKLGKWQEVAQQLYDR